MMGHISFLLAATCTSLLLKAPARSAFHADLLKPTLTSSGLHYTRGHTLAFGHVLTWQLHLVTE